MNYIGKSLSMNTCKEINYSFVMVYYNHIEITIQTLKTLILSLEADIVGQGVEIILIDNGSKERLDTVHLNSDIGINIRIFKLENNMGYPVGINYGISKCTGEVIVIVNNDLIFTKGWLSPLIKTLYSHSSIGLVGPLLSHASGSQHFGFYSSDIAKIHMKAKEIMNLRKEAYETNRVIGACMILKRKVIESVGGNDFWFGPGNYDDDDWCLRIRLAGYKILIDPSSFVYHIGSVTFQDANFELSLIDNQKRKFVRKWQIECAEERYKVLDRKGYNKEDYYIPIKINECLKIGCAKKMSGVLIVADWSSQTSNWLKVINKLLRESKEKYYLWVPSNYFEPINESTPSNFCFITHSIPHVNILQFINQFERIMKIEDDFINAYLISITQYTSTKVICI